MAISHETIYRHIWRDLHAGGTLHEPLRNPRKSCPKEQPWPESPKANAT
jgi:hypothetical protein